LWGREAGGIKWTGEKATERGRELFGITGGKIAVKWGNGKAVFLPN